MTTLTLELIRKAMAAFLDYSHDVAPVVLPPHLYDEAKREGINLDGYVRRGYCPRKERHGNGKRMQSENGTGQIGPKRASPSIIQETEG